MRPQATLGWGSAPTGRTPGPAPLGITDSAGLWSGSGTCCGAARCPAAPQSMIGSARRGSIRAWGAPDLWRCRSRCARTSTGAVDTHCGPMTPGAPAWLVGSSPGLAGKGGSNNGGALATLVVHARRKDQSHDLLRDGHWRCARCDLIGDDRNPMRGAFSSALASPIGAQLERRWATTVACQAHAH